MHISNYIVTPNELAEAVCCEIKVSHYLSFEEKQNLTSSHILRHVTFLGFRSSSELCVTSHAQDLNTHSQHQPGKPPNLMKY